ncbi:MAG: hypothetical protein ACLRT4_01780 [Thomasclavelia sp.]
MDTKKINQKAIESLKKYFIDRKEIAHDNLQPLSKEEVTSLVDAEISRYKAKIDELNELKRKIELEAEESFTKIFGTPKEEVKKHRLNTDEMEEQLAKETQHQLDEMNKIKEANKK